MSTDKNIDLLPEGFHDRLYDDAAIISRHARRMIDTLQSHGYKRVMPAIAEYESSLSSGLEGAQRNQLLRFTDPLSGRTLALRSDMTVQIGRIAASRLAHAARPLRLSYHGIVTKLRTDALNPNREMTQLGAELIGSDSVSAAGEIVAIAIEALQSIGISGITIDLTLPDLVQTLAEKTFPLSDENMRQVRDQLDMKDASGLKALGADDYLPLIAATGEFDDAIQKLSDIDAGGALSSRIKGLKSIAANITDDVHITLDPTERHGFEYQNWFGFTLYADNIAGAIGRGGSYNLSNGESATGFSLYPDVLSNMLKKMADMTENKRLFLPKGHDAHMAKTLRQKGWITIGALSDDDDGAVLGCSHYLQGHDVVSYAK